MGRRRPDWWSEQQRHLQQHRGDDSPDDECPRNAANARERARMRVLSKAFGRLKTTLPWVPADTKLSKLDTLRLATTYIAHLSSLLATTAPERQLMADRSASTTATAATPGNGPQPQNCNAVMTWPYSAHNTVKECSSPEEEYNRYDCCSKLEDKISYSTYDMYFTSSINS